MAGEMFEIFSKYSDEEFEDAHVQFFLEYIMESADLKKLARTALEDGKTTIALLRLAIDIIHHRLQAADEEGLYRGRWSLFSKFSHNPKSMIRLADELNDWFKEERKMNDGY